MTCKIPSWWFSSQPLFSTMKLCNIKWKNFHTEKSIKIVGTWFTDDEQFRTNFTKRKGTRVCIQTRIIDVYIYIYFTELTLIVSVWSRLVRNRIQFICGEFDVFANEPAVRGRVNLFPNGVHVPIRGTKSARFSTEEEEEDEKEAQATNT